MSGNRKGALDVMKRVSVLQATELKPGGGVGRDLQVTQKVRRGAGAAPQISPASPRGPGLRHLFFLEKGFPWDLGQKRPEELESQCSGRLEIALFVCCFPFWF